MHELLRAYKIPEMQVLGSLDGLVAVSDDAVPC